MELKIQKISNWDAENGMGIEMGKNLESLKIRQFWITHSNW